MQDVQFVHVQRLNQKRKPQSQVHVCATHNQHISNKYTHDV